MSAGYKILAELLAFLAFIAAIFGAGFWTGENHIQQKWDADKIKVAQAQEQAILERVANNQVLVNQNAADRAAITKAKDEELARTTAALTKRLRRGAGICSGPSTYAKADSASSSNDASASSGLFRDDIQRDLVAAIKAAEDATSTARACQAFIIANGMQP